MSAFVSEVDEGQGVERKRAKVAKNATLDKALFNWFSEKRAEDTPLSGTLIHNKAGQLNEVMGHLRVLKGGCSGGRIGS